MQLDDLVDARTPYAGVPSMHGGRLVLQLSIDDADLYAAHSAAERVALAAADEVRLCAGIATVEVLTSPSSSAASCRAWPAPWRSPGQLAEHGRRGHDSR